MTKYIVISLAAILIVERSYQSVLLIHPPSTQTNLSQADNNGVFVKEALHSDSGDLSSVPRCFSQTYFGTFH